MPNFEHEDNMRINRCFKTAILNLITMRVG